MQYSRSSAQYRSPQGQIKVGCVFGIPQAHHRPFELLPEVFCRLPKHKLTVEFHLPLHRAPTASYFEDKDNEVAHKIDKILSKEFLALGRGLFVAIFKIIAYDSRCLDINVRKLPSASDDEALGRQFSIRTTRHRFERQLEGAME